MADHPTSPSTAQRVLVFLHYSAPIILLVFFLLVYTIRSVLLTDNANSVESPSSTKYGPGGKPLPKKLPIRDKTHLNDFDFTRPRKLLFAWLSVAAALTFVGNGANVIMHAVIEADEGWWCGKSTVVYIIGCFFIYSLFLISLIDTKPSPTTAHLSTWVLALIIELTLLSASISIYSGRHEEPQVDPTPERRWRDHMTDWEAAEVLTNSGRIVLLAALSAFYLLFVVSRNAKIRAVKHADENGSVEENTSLLGQNGSANGSTTGYGSSPGGGKHRHTEGAPPGWERPTNPPSRSWWEYIKGYTMFFPFLWPSKSRRLQIMVVVCFCIMLLQRGINLLVPRQLGIITDILADKSGPKRMPWSEICLFLVYKFMQGNNGLLGALRGNLWIPVSQYSYRELSIASFEHVHSLSLEFHLGKKTGEVLSALGKGSSINTFLEQVTFSVIPMLVDLCVAIGYFLVRFDVYYALIVSVVTFWYVYVTIRMASWRADIRRQMVNADREEDAVKNDSMVSYETVKYFNAEPWEFKRYMNAVEKYQKAEQKVLTSLNLMNVAQNIIFMLGLLAACFLVSYQITIGERKVGDFAIFTAYMAQLQQPLNFFGTFYRMIQSAMINSERMLELFKEKPTVVDSEFAEPIPSCEGGISFNDVKFAYDSRKPALSGLSFDCKPGTTTALVGESGGGKSTVFRLLFRFYNAQAGSIQLDGHDVQGVTIDSLRKQIGVVPQDTVLFNESLMYNLKYARQGATDEEVYEACRNASIHEKIMTFPDGYETKVGERGLRLSGGEKQRVAIARTILKNPRIILLDEATAALDTETEQHIQDALATLGNGRTMLIIAHRLSTITLADQIVVLHEGRVDEVGTHDGLLAKKGRYASMWRKQVRAQKAAEEAKLLKDRAERLRKEAGVGVNNGADGGSASQSEDEREGNEGGGRRSKGVNAGARPRSGMHSSQNSEDLGRRDSGGGGGKPVGHP